MTGWTTYPISRRHKECKTASTNWLDLPLDLTLMIISRLDTFQILTSVKRVCRRWWHIWRHICMYPLMWRTINMCNIGFDNSVDFDLEKMCRYAIDRSCGLLEDISIEYFGSDDLLKYILDSQCQLRRLQLVQCFYCISDKGLCEIAQRLPMLEELDFALVQNVSSVALEAIGRGCPLLKSFKFNENWGSNEEAFAIAQNMPNLRHLQLANNYLDNSGVSAILDGCPLLESLDLRGCQFVKLEGELRKRCDEQLKDFKEPDTPYEFRGFKFGYLNYETAYYDFTFEEAKLRRGDGELSDNSEGVQFEK
ncbi:hypothetical protein PIB30_072570 [Stylosanthes scabra]|uniref:F-box domain-containing protein n=1 Tax=Stylosanthes scabra TaxID=79078 RepID=A0ABU6RPB3_9FABA|nr:hypothetical protein [Stylosanthes scabra]